MSKTGRKNLRDLRQEKIERLNKSVIPTCAMCDKEIPRSGKRKIFCCDGCQAMWQEERDRVLRD